jgi:hypothetical protein
MNTARQPAHSTNHIQKGLTLLLLKKDRPNGRPFLFSSNALLSLGNFAILQATGANANALRIAIAIGGAHRVKIGKKAALGNAGRMKTDTAFVLGRTLADNHVAR